MSFETIPPFDHDEVRALGWRLVGLLGLVLGICFAYNCRVSAQLDAITQANLAHREALHGKK